MHLLPPSLLEQRCLSKEWKSHLALGRPDLEQFFQLWTPLYKKEMDILGQDQ